MGLVCEEGAGADESRRSGFRNRVRTVGPGGCRRGGSTSPGMGRHAHGERRHSAPVSGHERDFQRRWEVSRHGGRKSAQIWKTQGWQPVARLAHQDQIEAVVFSPSRPFLATAGDDKTARIWEIESGVEALRVTHLGPVVDVAFDRSGRYLATASVDRSARVVEAPVESRSPWETGKPTAAAFSPSGARIATGDLSGAVRIWDVEMRQLAKVASSLGREITAVGFSPDERVLAVGAYSGAASVIDVSSGAQVSRFDHGARIKGIVTETRGNWVFTGGDDGNVKVWSAADGRLAATLEQHDPVTSLAISPDGSRLAVTTGIFGSRPHGAFLLWDVNARRLLRRVEQPVALQGVALSEDSRAVATAGQDNQARVWDAASGREAPPAPHDQPVWAVRSPRTENIWRPAPRMATPASGR